jgi:hypothetical protein
MKNDNATSGCQMRLTVAQMTAPMTRDEGKLRG